MCYKHELARYKGIVEEKLFAIVDGCGAPKDLKSAMRYSLEAGGKRLRPAMTLYVCEMLDGDIRRALPFACALEMIHTYSLIHDDLPCMDDDELRRGKPSCHVKFGEAEALLAGDGLLTYAFELCASNDNVSHKSVRLAVAELSHEAGILGMVGGQTLDLENNIEKYAELKKIYAEKTGALITAACLLGYFAAVDKPLKKDIDNIKLYAASIGLAFQIHDDILDVKSTTEVLGKEVGSDEKNNKKTSLAFSLEEAEEEETLLTLLSVEAISAYSGSDILCRLAVWLLSRKK